MPAFKAGSKFESWEFIQIYLESDLLRNAETA
jgi:hypothetical protein